MRIVDYHHLALSTAIYRELKGGDQPTYPALGLAGEAGEICEKLADGVAGEELAKELGDVLWYIANLAEDMGTDMPGVARAAAPFIADDSGLDFDQFQAYGAGRSGWPAPGSPSSAALRLAGKACAICERVKKLIRDDDSVLTDERRALIVAGLADTLAAVAALASELEAGLGDIAATNIEKLKSRKKRDRIKGDGDNR